MITELLIFITIRPTMLVILEPTMLLRTDKTICIMRTITHALTVTTMVTTVVVNLANRNSHVSLAIKVTMVVVMEHRQLKDLPVDHLLNGLDIIIQFQMGQWNILAIQLVFGQMRVLDQMTVLSHYQLRKQMPHLVALVLLHLFNKMEIITDILSDQSQLKR